MKLPIRSTFAVGTFLLVLHSIRGRQAEDVWYSSEASFPENVKDRVRALLPPLELSLEMIPTLKTVFVSDGPLSAKLGVGFPFELQLFFDGEKQRLRKTRDTNQDRKLLFWALEHGLGKLGLDGRACVLRAVCEAADHPFREAGLFGEVLHVLLQIPESGYNGTTLKAYYEAGKVGRYEGKCHQRYASCPLSIFSISAIK
ncbi:hypothetical protein ISCGN_001756 [Ixodes scapularis]